MIVEGISDDVLFVCGGFVVVVVVVVVLLIKSASSGSARGRAPRPEQHSSYPAERASSRSSPESAAAGEFDSSRSSESAAQSQSARDERERLEGRIDVVIKTVAPERRHVVSVSANATVASLKERAFPDFIAEGRRIRLVFRGRVLSNTVTLRSVGVIDNAVVHAVISERGQVHRDDDEDAGDLSRYFLPILGAVLIVVWLLLLSYPHLFATAPRVMLVGLTAYFSLACYTSQRAPSTAR